MAPPELETQIAVLETEQDFLKQELREMKEYTNDIYDMIFDIKERMDKQNGTIPHLAIEVSEISKNLHTVILKTEKDLVKSKIIWGGGVFLITTGVSIILKLIGL